MDDRLEAERRLRDLIDAVRPASDDLSRPEFADLAALVGNDPQLRRAFQRSQRLDLAIADAMHDLPVPPGSVERLLVALDADAAALSARPTTGTAVGEQRGPGEQGRPEAAASQSTAAPSAADRAGDVRDTGPAHRQRRAWRWAGAAAVATLSGAAVAVWLFLPSAVPVLGPADILTSDWILSLDEAAAVHQDINHVPPPAQYPTSGALAAKPVAWRKIAGLLGRDGVAYQLVAGGNRGTLYVLSADGGHNAPQLVRLPNNPPGDPADVSRNQAMSVWQSGKLVYLLVVAGGPAEYQAFLRPPGQLARAARSSVFSLDCRPRGPLALLPARAEESS